MRTPMRWTALSLAGVLFLAGCSGGGADSASDSGAADIANDSAAEAPAQEPAAEADPGAGDNGAGDLAPADLGDTTANEGDDDLSDENIAAAGRSVITEGTVSVTVEDPTEVVQDITQVVTRAGGWVEGVTQRGTTEDEGAHASIVVRLPSGEVGGALEHLRTYGTVDAIDLTRTDVTAQVRDMDARIAAMEMSVERMSQFLAQATNRQELLEAEQMFTDRQAQLEALLSQKRTVGDQLSMSTLTINLWTPESAPPPPKPEPEPTTGFFAGLTNGWNAFYETGSDVLMVVGALLPWLVFLALLALVGVVIRRPLKRRQAAMGLSAASQGPAGQGPAGQGPAGQGPTTALPPMGAAAPYGYPAPGGQPWPGQPAPGQPVAPAAPPAPPTAKKAGEQRTPA